MIVIILQSFYYANDMTSLDIQEFVLLVRS